MRQGLDALPGPVLRPRARGGPIPTRALGAPGPTLAQEINDPAVEMDRRVAIAPALTANVPPDRLLIEASGHIAPALRPFAVLPTQEIGSAGILRVTIGDRADPSARIGVPRVRRNTADPVATGMRLVGVPGPETVRFAEAGDPRRPAAGFRPSAADGVESHVEVLFRSIGRPAMP